jgi:hypothetical protein
MTIERDNEIEQQPWPEADPLGAAFSQVFAAVFAAIPADCAERKAALIAVMGCHARLRDLLNKRSLSRERTEPIATTTKTPPKPPPMPPLRLSDSELDAIMDAARPIAAERRDAFLHAVAQALAARSGRARCTARSGACSGPTSTRRSTKGGTRGRWLEARA